MSKIILCSGIPLSGKSTWAFKQLFNIPKGFTSNLVILSRDSIRLELFGKKYKQNNEDEKRVNDVFNFQFYNYTNTYNFDIIIDNTNCKLKYINEIKRRIPDNYEYEVKRFDISLWKAYWRNIKRWILTGKFIPFKIIKQMKFNYDKLWNL